MLIHAGGSIKTDGTIESGEETVAAAITRRASDGHGTYVGIYGRRDDGHVVYESLAIDRTNRDDVLTMVGADRWDGRLYEGSEEQTLDMLDPNRWSRVRNLTHSEADRLPSL